MKMLLVFALFLAAAVPAVAQPSQPLQVDTDAKLKLAVWASTFRADDWSGEWYKHRPAATRLDADRTQLGIGIAMPTSDTWTVSGWLENAHTDFAPLSGTTVGLRVEYTLW